MNLGFTKTYIAGAAVEARRIVKFDGSGNIVECTADTDLMIGVSDAVGDVASGERIDVQMTLQPEVEASAAIAAGASVSSAADGRAKTAQTGDVAIGFAIEAAAAAGDIIAVHLCRHTL